MPSGALAVDVPNPIDVVTHVISAPAGWAWEKVAQGIASWVLGAVAFFVDGIVNFLLTSARPNVEAAWFSGPGSPYATVRNIAGVLLLGFLFLGLIQGLLAGDATAMIRRVAADLPAAVLGMIGTTVIVGKLLELTDALSAAVLAHSGGQAVHFLSGFGVTANGATQGFAAVLLGLVAVIAGLLLWIELMVRSVLIYILVALSPLSFAAMVWPSARGVLHRTIELLLAVILSKLVVCVAISVGVAALAGAGTAGGNNAGIGGQATVSMGTLFVGTSILVIAAFAPFLVLKLIPWTETALVAHGMSRSPVRAANSTISTANSANSVARLAGGGSKSAPALPAGGSGSGWIVGAPLQGSAAGGASVGAAAGPAGVAAAGAVAVASGAAKGAARSLEASSEAISGGGTAKPEPARNAGKSSAQRSRVRRSRSGMDAPPPDKDTR
jgi:type IV secretion system protein TrbL